LSKAEVIAMTFALQQQKARQFQQLHQQPPILVLLNAWDAASARVFELTGAPAIATTSSGVAASLGYPDGQHISRALLLETTARIVRVVQCPVSADIEAGYGATIEEVLQTVRGIIDAGAVGLNIEDSTRGPGRALADRVYQVELIQAIRELADSLNLPLVINARTDGFLLAPNDPESAFDEAVQRGNVYRQAGANCVFPIGLSNADLIARFAKAVDGPINIMLTARTPTIPALAELGVARVSLAGGLMRAALGHLRQIAQELLASGVSASLMRDALSSADFQHLFG
jgi:2-methylisocitrate lyase-like PEP mutase family enzyme